MGRTTALVMAGAHQNESHGTVDRRVHLTEPAGVCSGYGFTILRMRASNHLHLLGLVTLFKSGRDLSDHWVLAAPT